MSLCHHHVTNRPITVLGFLAAMIVVSSPARAQIIFVDAANCPGPGDGTMVDPFCSIQDAIADPGTINGDEIEVAPGTYFEAIDFLGKTITVRSTDPNDPGVVLNTIINGTGFFHVVQCVMMDHV